MPVSRKRLGPATNVIKRTTFIKALNKGKALAKGLLTYCYIGFAVCMIKFLMLVRIVN